MAADGNDDGNDDGSDHRARIAAAGERLTPAERRVAAVVLDDPHAVGFGTAADVAARAAVGAGSVVRLAERLGYAGFGDLRRAVRHDLAQQLRPAAERIRHRAPAHTTIADQARNHLEVEAENLRATLSGAAPATLDAVTERLARRDRPVAVLSGDASAGVGRQLATELSAVRDGVTIVDGNDVAVTRTIALLPEGTTLVAIDLRRYDRWVIDAARSAAALGAHVVALTDGELSPLTAVAHHVLVIAAASPGPFDSHVGALALVQLLSGLTARRLASTAGDRLQAAEDAWRRHDRLIEP